MIEVVGEAVSKAEALGSIALGGILEADMARTTHGMRVVEEDPLGVIRTVEEVVTKEVA